MREDGWYSNFGTHGSITTPDPISNFTAKDAVVRRSSFFASKTLIFWVESERARIIFVHYDNDVSIFGLQCVFRQQAQGAYFAQTKTS